jgi:hypothetical protein
MMETASISETSVNFNQSTWCNYPEDGHLHDNESAGLIKGMKRLEYVSCRRKATLPT